MTSAAVQSKEKDIAEKREENERKREEGLVWYGGIDRSGALLARQTSDSSHHSFCS